MTNLRTAAQQALEAMQIAAAELDSPYTSETPEERVLRAAITALRAALAEKCSCGDRLAVQCPGEWEPGCDLGSNPKYAVRSDLAESAQEPVGQMGAMFRTHPAVELQRSVESAVRPACGVDPAAKAKTGPLTAAPVQEPVACSNTFACRCPKHYTAEPVQEPQRKPLTDEEIKDFYYEHAKYQEAGARVSGWWEFARAVERAHGIKE